MRHREFEGKENDSMDDNITLVISAPFFQGAGARLNQMRIALAQRLRKETTMSLKWIALRLQMGSWSYVSNLLAANWGRRG